MTADDPFLTEYRADEDAALWRLTSALATSPTPPEVAEALAQDGGEAVGAVFAQITVYELGSNQVQPILQVPGFEASTSAAFDLGESRPACDAIRVGMPVLLGSSEEIARRYPHLGPETSAAGLRAAAALPLLSAAGAPIGALTFGWRLQQSFTAAQLRRLDLIAQLTGLALERAIGQEFAPQHIAPVPQALETMPSAFFSLDLDLRITYVNLEAARALRRSREGLVGRNLVDVFPDVGEGGFVPHCREAMANGMAVVFEEYYAPFGGWFEVHAWPSQRGLYVYFSDIGSRRTVELQRSAALSKAEQSNARLRFLTEISTRLSGVTTREEVFDRLTRAVVPTMADWCTLVVPSANELVRVAAVHRDRVLDGLAKRLVDSYPHDYSGPSPGVVVYRSGEPLRLARLAQQIIADLDDSAASAAYGRTLQLLGDGPGLITPVSSHGEIVAILTMIRNDGESFSDDEVEFMREVAERAASALEVAHNVEAQRAMASALQAASLPLSLPSTDWLSLGASYRAASAGSEVGGDWYDAFELPNNSMALVVGDTAGHGVSAAAVMAQLRNELRAFLFAGLGPLESLASLNRLLVAQSPDTFATIICLEVEQETAEVRWASAGHPLPVLVRANGTSAHLRGEVMAPIGLADIHSNQPRIEHRLALNAADRLILFTDGLIERRGVDQQIGLAHLMILAEQTRRVDDPSSVCERILRDVLVASHEDDVCLLVADFNPGS